MSFLLSDLQGFFFHIPETKAMFIKLLQVISEIDILIVKYG